MKQNASHSILEIDDPPNFQIQVANGQLEKPLAPTTRKFDIGDNTFAEHIVVMKKLTGPIIGLHFMRNNSVLIDTTHGLIQFPYLTIQVKSTSGMSEKLQIVIIGDALTIPPKTTKLLTAFVDHPSELNTTGTVTTLEKFTKNQSAIFIGKWQESVSESNQYNESTSLDQKKHTNCRVFRSQSGTN